MVCVQAILNIQNSRATQKDSHATCCLITKPTLLPQGNNSARLSKKTTPADRTINFSDTAPRNAPRNYQLNNPVVDKLYKRSPQYKISN